jgi:hypothetical protein
LLHQQQQLLLLLLMQVLCNNGQQMGGILILGKKSTWPMFLRTEPIAAVKQLRKLQSNEKIRLELRIEVVRGKAYVW